MRDFGVHLIDGDASGRRKCRQSGDHRVQVSEISRPKRRVAHREGQELWPRFLAEGDSCACATPELFELIVEVWFDVLSTIRKPWKAEGPQIDAGK